MTPEQLAEIEARAAAATPGPWEWEPTRRGVEWEDESGLPFFPQGATLGETLIQLGDTYEGYRQDCSFIAHSRQDISALCAEVRRLQNGIAKIEARWREASQDKTFRSHYRGTMAECADELSDLLAGSVDEDALRAEINKTLDEDELLTRDQMPWFRENMR